LETYETADLKSALLPFGISKRDESSWGRNFWTLLRPKTGALRNLLTALALLIFATTAVFAADKKIILPPGAKPGGNYSPGILVDGTLYISGQVGRDSSGKYPEDFEAEVKQTLENVDAILKAAEMSPGDVVSVQIYLTDAGTFERMNAVYREFFKEPRPTRTTVVVAKLIGAARIEITVTAKK
jgi:2-iminobutanoate/2-iminopropanoate deaminase